MEETEIEVNEDDGNVREGKALRRRKSQAKVLESTGRRTRAMETLGKGIELGRRASWPSDL